MSLPTHRTLEEAVEFEALLCERMARAGTAAQNFHMRRVAVRERARAAAAQAKPPAGQPPQAQRDAGRREPTPAQAARKLRSQAKLRAKHLERLARKLQAAARIRKALFEWHLRAARRLVQRYSQGVVDPDELIVCGDISFHSGVVNLYASVYHCRDDDHDFTLTCLSQAYDDRLAYYDECRSRPAKLALWTAEDEDMPPPALTGPAAKSRGRPSPGLAPPPPPPDATAVVAVDDVSAPSSSSPPSAQPAVRRRCLGPRLEAAAAADTSAPDRLSVPPGLVPPHLAPQPPVAADAPPDATPAIIPGGRPSPQHGTAPPPRPPTETAAAVPADAASFATPRRPTAAGRPDAPRA